MPEGHFMRPLFPLRESPSPIVAAVAAVVAAVVFCVAAVAAVGESFERNVHHHRCYSCYIKNNSCYNRCYSCYRGGNHSAIGAAIFALCARGLAPA